MGESRALSGSSGEVSHVWWTPPPFLVPSQLWVLFHTFRMWTLSTIDKAAAISALETLPTLAAGMRPVRIGRKGLQDPYS